MRAHQLLTVVLCAIVITAALADKAEADESDGDNVIQPPPQSQKKRAGTWCRKAGRAARQELPRTCRVAFVSGGSFIHLRNAMASVQGVLAAVRGYTGGYVAAPTYEDVCRGETGHAEAVLVAYDSSVTDYRTILEQWLTNHDPKISGAMVAVVNDVTYYGSQFRSSVFVRMGSERRMFRRALKAYVKKNGGEWREQRKEFVSRSVGFDGTFIIENRTEDELVSVRTSIEPDPHLRQKYQRRYTGKGLVANVSIEQRVGEDDAAVSGFADLEKMGKLQGAARRSARDSIKAAAKRKKHDVDVRNVTDPYAAQQQRGEVAGDHPATDDGAPNAPPEVTPATTPAKEEEQDVTPPPESTQARAHSDEDAGAPPSE